MVEPERITQLNGAPETPGDYVLYWMQQSQRAVHNPALEVAVAAANRLRLPLVTGFGLTTELPAANARHYAFMLQGLAETAEQLRARGIAFVIRHGRPPQVALELARHAALVVCDDGYLRRQKRWRAEFARHADRRVLAVEGDVVVPAGLASRKAEIGARTLRARLEPHRRSFITPLRAQRVRVRADRLALGSDVELGDVPSLVAGLRVDQSVAAVPGFRGGHSEARRRLRSFLAHGLAGYGSQRSCLTRASVSRLSPYLHFGQMSPVEVALAVTEASAPATDRASFLEELIVRRELAVNFVNATGNYDRYECLPAWARATLKRHRHDRREHLYSFQQLLDAGTHDAYWNAAMRDMRCTGFLHNHLRMYWGKKVLEWSASAEEGYQSLLHLNNRFFLDGRDPSSFANVGWVFGLHDRPWPERPIFGNVRYMNAAGLRRKTDIEDYMREIDARAE